MNATFESRIGAAGAIAETIRRATERLEASSASLESKQTGTLHLAAAREVLAAALTAESQSDFAKGFLLALEAVDEALRLAGHSAGELIEAEPCH